LVMKHALSLVRILIKKNDYTGDGRVDAVTFGGVRLSASMDVTSGKLLPTGQPGEYKAGGNYTLDDASPVYVEAILMPVGTAEGITVNVHVDGRDF
ncbi:fimbrillin family protein, partial [Phocaeicola vulgatus]